MAPDDDFWFVQARSGGMWIGADPLRFKKWYQGGVPPEIRAEVARGDFGAVESPPTFLVDRRGKTRDFLWALGEPYKVVSSRVIDVLTAADATGWSAVPVGIRYKNAEQLDGYHLLAVTGSCDSIHASYDPTTRHLDFEWWLASGIDVTEGWDGSDLFYSRGRASTYFITTDRIMKAFEAAELTGMEPTPSTEFVIRVH